jgi:hypothetical protein
MNDPFISSQTWHLACFIGQFAISANIFTKSLLRKISHNEFLYQFVNYSFVLSIQMYLKFPVPDYTDPLFLYAVIQIRAHVQ